MTQDQADTYWRKLINDPDLYQDEEGFNSDFPTKVDLVETKCKLRLEALVTQTIN